MCPETQLQEFAELIDNIAQQKNGLLYKKKKTELFRIFNFQIQRYLGTYSKLIKGYIFYYLYILIMFPN